MTNTEFIFSLSLVILAACFVQSTPRIVYKSLSSDGGLIFYDLESNRTLLPPVVSALPYEHEQQREPLQVTSRRPMFPTFRRPCSCNELNCGCCAGINFKQFNFRRQSKHNANEFLRTVYVVQTPKSNYLFQSIFSVHELHIRSERVCNSYGRYDERGQPLPQYGVS